MLSPQHCIGAARARVGETAIARKRMLTRALTRGPTQDDRNVVGLLLNPPCDAAANRNGTSGGSSPTDLDTEDFATALRPTRLTVAFRLDGDAYRAEVALSRRWQEDVEEAIEARRYARSLPAASA
jgi:hypothetical protein